MQAQKHFLRILSPTMPLRKTSLSVLRVSLPLSTNVFPAQALKWGTPPSRPVTIHLLACLKRRRTKSTRRKRQPVRQCGNSCRLTQQGKNPLFLRQREPASSLFPKNRAKKKSLRLSVISVVAMTVGESVSKGGPKRIRRAPSPGGFGSAAGGGVRSLKRQPCAKVVVVWAAKGGVPGILEFSSMGFNGVRRSIVCSFLFALISFCFVILDRTVQVFSNFF
mmetsp:Transcript_40239/g.79316  ORF Transcript_40239/g.79316 Transcript_40239/m.79316 type:complete len:221 (-) Transcript_40239:413-1075(-)